MTPKFAGITCAIVAGFLLLMPLPLRAGVATEQVRAMVEHVQMIVQDPRLQSEARKKDRRAALRRVIGRRIDFAEMAKRSLGSHWQGRTPKQQTEFVKLFTDLVEDAYLGQIESYPGDKFVYLREIRDGEFAEVDSKLNALKGDEIAINYRLRGRNADWKVYDVVIENVSVVGNYRSQFNRILSGASFDELLKKLRETRVRQIQARRSRPDNTLLSYWLLAQASPNRPR
jgi:phospholipid transport system substrate-binding protein